MPGKVKVKIISGRNLPVMDRSGDTTDAYVEIKLGGTTFKTDVCRKSLNPNWNSEWYRFEVDDTELQDEPLQIRLMDHDTYSANDAIGKVYLDLNPLLLPVATWNGDRSGDSNSIMSGWIPVYDTMHGIRGEVNVIVKVELFSDFNRFRQSSCGIQFFCSKSVPQGYFAQTVHGFVEELIINDDPEYQWIDKIRTPRASNEARQTLFFKLSGELQRKIGVKALDMGGNAVMSYCQCFDLEGDSGIVARGIGTAVTLIKILDLPSNNIAEMSNEERAESYLKFLGCNAGFRLNCDSVKALPPKKYPTPIYTNIPENPRYNQLAKHLYNKELNPHLRYCSKSNPSLNETIHHHSVKTLLKQEDMRGTPGHGIGQRIKNFKYSSQSILSKKMIALKAKLGDTGIGEEDIEIKPDTSDSTKRKAFKYKRTVSDSNVMAELLARSVIHAQNSLTCILESQDSTQHEDDEDEEDDDNEPEANAKPEVEPTLEKTVSEPFLSMKELESSSESSSSSDDENDDESDSKDNINLETVSNIVKNVERLENTYNYSKCKNFSKQYSLPAIPFDDCEFDDVAGEELNPFIFPEFKKDVGDSDIVFSLGDYEETEEIADVGHPFESTAVSSKDDAVIEDAQNKRAPIAKTESDGSTEELPVVSIPAKKTIIPPVMMGAGMQNHSLVKTAMQTILMDKLNIMGTYTPPASPVSPTSKSLFSSSPASSSSSIPTPNRARIYSTGFLNTSSSSVQKLPRSSTAVSLDEWNGKHETVLGAPFTSMNSVANFGRQTSHPCLSVQYYSTKDLLDDKSTDELNTMCLSDSELIKPQSSGKKFSFLLRKPTAEELKRGLSHENLHKRKFSFLHLHRRKSHEPYSDLKKVKNDEGGKFRFLGRHRKPSENESGSGKNLISSIFHHHHNKKDENSSSLKKHGLLGTALGNVVMETVQDILATSHGDHAEKDSEVTSKHPFPSSSILTCTNDGKSSDDKVNTEIDKGNSVSQINMHASLTPSLRSGSPEVPEQSNHHRADSVGTKIVHSPAKLNNTLPGIHRRSSDSDLSITPKGNSLTGSDRSGCGPIGHPPKINVSRMTMPQENFDMLEYPFLTMSKYPPGFITQIGGSVSARSVKLLERVSNIDEPEMRNIWWSEIRLEIRSHARALNCNAVLAYLETTSICEDVCVLSASGTAAVIGCPYPGEVGDSLGATPKSLKETTLLHDSDKIPKDKCKNANDSPDHNVIHGSPCIICHLPYNTNNVPVRSTVSKCAVCRTGKVPEMLIATIEVPDGVPTIGHACFIQSFVCRQLKDCRSESNAKEISDGLPFLEYELHRILINKLKIKGMNAIFGLKIRISIGEKMLLGMATGTAVFLEPLKPPVLPKLVSTRTSDEKKLNDLQKMVIEYVKKSKEIYQLKGIEENQNGRVLSDDESEEEQTSIDMSLGNKDCCVLEVDDPEDAEVVNLLLEERPPNGFHVVNTEFVPKLDELEIVKNLQMFTQIYRTKIQIPYNFNMYFQRLLQSVYFKLRRMVPCALCDLQFRVEIPEPDEIQLCVLGMALGLGEIQKHKFKHDELIFNLEEDQIPENCIPSTPTQISFLNAHQSSRHRQKSPLRNRIQTIKQRHVPYRERHGVDITPLSYIPGGKIEHYLGNLNFFFIRETTSLREEGGLSGFIHSFVTEVLAIVRAHVTALGGNAMVAYFMTECVLNHNLHKNQGQCLINVGGDVVFVSYFKEDL